MDGEIRMAIDDGRQSGWGDDLGLRRMRRGRATHEREAK
jgi:hypothetical protein